MSLFKKVYEPLIESYDDGAIKDVRIVKSGSSVVYVIVKTSNGIDVLDEKLKKLFHFKYPFDFWFWDHPDDPVLIRQDSAPTIYYLLMHSTPVKMKINDNIRYFMQGSDEVEPFAIDSKFSRLYIFGNLSRIFSLSIDEIHRSLLKLFELASQYPKVYSMHDVNVIVTELMKDEQMTVTRANELSLPTRILFNISKASGWGFKIKDLGHIKTQNFWIQYGPNIVSEFLSLPEFQCYGPLLEDDTTEYYGMFKPSSSFPLPIKGMKIISKS